MFHRKSISELRRIMNDLIEYRSQVDSDSGRDTSSDHTLLASEKIYLVLNSDIDAFEKKNLLLQQIGLLRINICSAYSFKINILEDNEQLDEAIILMNQYFNEVALPFIGETRKPSYLDRFKDALAIERSKTPRECIDKWHVDFSDWFNTNWDERYNAYKKLGIYNSIKSSFSILHGLSFSNDNFPPAPTIVIVNQ